MKNLNLCFLSLVISFTVSACFAQSAQQSHDNIKKIVGGGCDGCELMYIGMPKKINSEDISPGWHETGKKLILTGNVFQLDGITPAENVIIYYWQTDNEGYYSTRPGLDRRVLHHGHIRGWVKTDKNGKYTIKTIRPAPYPNDDSPAHIHLSVKEPEIADEYYTDDVMFDDDKLLIPYKKRYPPENRGGSGIVRILLKGHIQIAEHDIILGLNIPNYPKQMSSTKLSGLNIGEDQPSFVPFHAFGPDKNTQTCPVCRYGRFHGIIYFVGDNANWSEIRSWLKFFEAESGLRGKQLKVYFVYGSDKYYSKIRREQFLTEIGTELGIRHIALTFVPSFADMTTEVHLNRINPDVENTIVIFKHRSIVAKFVGIKPTKQHFQSIKESLDKTQGDYFDLPEIDYH